MAFSCNLCQVLKIVYALNGRPPNIILYEEITSRNYHLLYLGTICAVLNHAFKM